jgi:hypothetical protein
MIPIVLTGDPPRWILPAAAVRRTSWGLSGRRDLLAPAPARRLLQLDVAINDSRANATTGWVFGTVQYEKVPSTSANWWDHLVPVGLMWGSDVTSPRANQQTKEEGSTSPAARSCILVERKRR